MECFALIRENLAMGGIEISQKSPKTYSFNVKNSVIFIVICLTVGSIAALLNESNTFDERTNILFQSVTFTICGMMYLIIVWKTSKLFEFINNSVNIVETRLKHPESQTLYTESSQKLEKLIRILDIALIKVTPALTIWPAVITSCITYFTTDLGNAALELPGPMWLPFDSSNPTGYSIAILIQYIFSTNIMIISKCLAIFGFGTCFMLFPLTDDMKNILRTINHNVRRKRYRSKTLDQFVELAQFHAKLIQLFHDYSDLLKMQLLVLLTWSVAGISTQMLLLTLKMDTFNTLEMINLSIIVFWSFTIIFGVCEFGERLSTTFEKINDVYGQSSWYLFPRKVKLMLPTLMIVAQKPLRLHVFGDISCGRITFENVFNTAYSWFMVLRRFEI